MIVARPTRRDRLAWTVAAIATLPALASGGAALLRPTAEAVPNDVVADYGLVIRPTGEGDPELISGPVTRWATDWSADGKVIALQETPAGMTRLATIPARSGSEATTYVEGAFVVNFGQFSPDGRWMAYESNETGRTEVYVDSFPKAGHRVRVSRAGGAWPKWRPDGKELYYLADRTLIAVSIDTSRAELTTSQPSTLFEGPAVGAVGARGQFAPNADGSKFLFNAVVEDHTPAGITVITNWPALVGKR